MDLAAAALLLRWLPTLFTLVFASKPPTIPTPSSSVPVAPGKKDSAGGRNRSTNDDDDDDDGKEASVCGFGEARDGVPLHYARLWWLLAVGLVCTLLLVASKFGVAFSTRGEGPHGLPSGGILWALCLTGWSLLASVAESLVGQKVLKLHKLTHLPGESFSRKTSLASSLFTHTHTHTHTHTTSSIR